MDGPHDRRGRVEIFYNGDWGTVCDDFWDNDDAQVVCRQLGFSGGEIWQDCEYGRGREDIFVDNLECTGSEERLADCSIGEMGVHNCARFEFACANCDP